MTGVRDVLGSALVEEPPTTVDPYAALATGRRRRTRRHRWLAAGATTAVVLGAVAAVGLPRLGPTDTGPVIGPTGGPAATQSPAVRLEWVPTAPSVGSESDLDVPRTLAGLDGVAERIQQELGLAAVAPAEPYHVDTKHGAVQLGYRTADGTEVHVVLTGGQSATVAAGCPMPIGSPAPTLPAEWPEWSPGGRPLGSPMCVPAPAVTTTRGEGGRLDRTVAQDADPYYRGGVAVTITSDESAPAPVTVETVAGLVDSLVPSVVFVEVTPGIEPPDLTWARTEPTRSGPGVLDLDRALKLLGGEIDQIQDRLGVHAIARARPADLPVERGALQLNYRATGDVEVQVLVVAADEATEQSAEPSCTYPPPPGPSDWPTDLSGKRPVIPHSPLCLQEPRVAVFDAGDGRLARTVVEYGDPPLGMLALTVVSDASAPAPVTLEAAEETLRWIHSLAW